MSIRSVVVQNIVAEEEKAQDAGHRKRAFYKFYVLLELIPIFHLEVPYVLNRLRESHNNEVIFKFESFLFLLIRSGDEMIYEENEKHILSLHAKSQKLHGQDHEIVLMMNDEEIRARIGKISASFGGSIALQ